MFAVLLVSVRNDSIVHAIIGGSHRAASPRALPQIVEGLRARSVSLVTVSRLSAARRGSAFLARRMTDEPDRVAAGVR